MELKTAEELVQLRNVDRQRVLNLLDLAFRGAVKVYAYGSRVKGTSWEASDLDLVVESERDISSVLKEIQNFRVNFEVSNVPIFVHIQHWDNLPHDYKSEINSHKVLFFEKS